MEGLLSGFNGLVLQYFQGSVVLVFVLVGVAVAFGRTVGFKHYRF